MYVLHCYFKTGNQNELITLNSYGHFLSRGASEKWDTQFTFSAEPVDQNQHDNVKPQTHPEDKPQDLSVDKPLSVMKEQTNKPQKFIQPQQIINSCKLEEKAVNHKKGGETAENGEMAKEEVKNMADENISEDWSSAAFLSPNQTNQQPRGAFKSELGLREDIKEIEI